MSVRTAAESGFDFDVAIIGGGPTGAAAGVFTARYGLETVVFDRGRSSLKRCAFLENYPDFPAGIDVETFYALLHDHVETAGCELVPDLVVSVDRREEEAGFVVDRQDGPSVSARRVVAATRYDGEYLCGLDEEDVLFETHDHGGEEHRHFDRSYPADDGRTPVTDLYVASPSTFADRQAIVAAGHGARVALTLLADVREERGFPAGVADRYDWLRREAERTEEWNDRDRWREWFDGRTPDDGDRDDDRRVAVREAEIDRRFDSYVTAEEIEDSRETAQQRLAEHLDDECLLAGLSSDRVLAHVDDEAIVEAAREIEDRRDAGEVSN